MLRVAFPLFGRGVWIGGLNYLANTLRLIKSRLAGEIEPWGFLSPREDEMFGGELRPLLSDRVIVDPRVASAGRGASLARTLIVGRDVALERLLIDNGIDVAFENASFYGSRFAVPMVSWIPDFQHRHMPWMFGPLNWLRRDLGFQMQVRSGRTIMVSSEVAQKDLERFYPTAKGRCHVVRFAIRLDPAPYLAGGGYVRRTYDLPDRFFFLPNQFWCHKNHAVIIEALGCIVAEHGLNTMPPVILTGQPEDPRSPSHFDDLMRRARELGIASHFRYLGLIPYEDVLSLTANCVALINPSRFEGWSTPIEEAKTFATPLVLADTSVHREQAPDALFFDWRSPEAAAEALREVAARPAKCRPSIETLRSAESIRLDYHARALLATVRSAAAERRERAALDHNPR